MITRTYAWAYSPYDAALPPPLGFVTHNTASHVDRRGRMHRGGVPSMMMGKPRIMMDPSDSSTWQRPYRFT